MKWLFWREIAVILCILFNFVVSQDLVLQCPQGWSQILANCYLQVSELQTTWSQANKYCQRYGGRLAEPAGQDVTARVSQLIINSTASHWIGFNQKGAPDNSPEQGFWADGKRTTVDVGWWDDFQPDRRGGECGVLKYTGEWKWLLANCQQLHPFICVTSACPSDTFRCFDGECLSSNYKCNGQEECSDGSDELDCVNSCKQHLSSNQGQIIHPTNQPSSYAPRSTCQWTIEGEHGKYLQIEISQLDLEDGIDVLEVWIGSQTISSARLIGRYTGRNLSNLPPVLSSNNNAIIRLVTDSTNQFSGFSLQWRSEFKCSIEHLNGYIASSETTTISTTSFNLSMCQNECINLMACVSFTFNSTTNQCQVMSEIPSLEPSVESSVYFKTCPQQIGSPVLPSLPLVSSILQATSVYKQLSSPLYPVIYLDNLVTSWTITTRGSQVITLEVLDLDLTTDGEVIIFDGDSPSSSQLLVLTNPSAETTITSTSQTVHILYNSGTADNINRRGFLLLYKEGCEFSIESDQGEISSPGYTRGHYPNILQCTWSIRSRQGTPISITFDPVFSLELDKDFLKVFRNIGRVDPVHPENGFTGSTSPKTIVSSNGELSLHLVTSALGTEKGFKATFSAGCQGLQAVNLVIVPYHATYTVNEVINVTCAPNHIFTNMAYLGLTSVKLACTSGGYFNKEIPVCSRVLCGAAPMITNGYISSNNGVLSGSTTTYTCDYGYNLTSTATITCQNSATWQNTPSCFARSCSKRSDIVEGRVQTVYRDGTSQGSVITYTCNTGYQIVGTPTQTCQDGTWSANPPTCQRLRCGYDPELIVNGVISPNGQWNIGDSLTMQCNQGYEIANGLSSSSFLCGEVPPTCANINECSKGTANCVQSTCVDTEGSFRCTCNPGFKQSTQTVCVDIRECGTSKGNCDHVCTELEGSYRCSCDTNYFLLTSATRNAITLPPGENGLESWNVYYFDHTCLRIECPIPLRVIGNGRSTSSLTKFYVGDTVSFVCDIGYKSQGKTTLTCLNTGAWDDSPPLCLDAMCPYPTVPNSANAVTIEPKTPIRYRDFYSLMCTQPTVSTELRACVYDPDVRDYRIVQGSLECPVADCGVPERIAGTLPYSYGCTTQGCSFTFQCRSPWFQRDGGSSSRNDVVTCGTDGHWDFGDLRCPGQTCSDPGTPAGGRQIATSYEEYSLVRYLCDQDNTKPGFEPSSPYPRQCYWSSNSQSLLWNGTTVTCVDRMAPTFSNCPTEDISVGQMSTSNIPEPRVTDNTNLIQTLNISPSKYSVSHIVKRDMTVIYEARDYSGNVATCSYNIKLKDEVSPTIQCLASFSVFLNNENDVRTYSVNSLVVSAADDSGSVQLSGSVNVIRLDKYSIGKTYTNTITATDPSGNTDQCVVQITAQAAKCRPWTLNLQNGQVNCNFKNNGGYTCTARCNTNYVIYDSTSTSVEISCDPNGDWTLPLPTCVAQSSSVYELTVRLSYRTSVLVPDYCQDTYRGELESNMATLVSSLSNECIELNPSIFVQRRSSVVIQNYSSGVYAVLSFNLEPRSYSSSVYSQCVDRLRNAFTSQASSVSSIRQLSNYPALGCPESSPFTFESTIQEGFGCSVNEERRQVSQSTTACVACPSGYSSTGGNLCIKCPVSMYRGENQETCQPCLLNSRNQTDGAASIHECYRSCPLGMTSASGQSPCTVCPVDTYSDSETTCQPCPTNTHTPGLGSHSINDCKGVCTPGYFSRTGYQPCQPCPKGFFQSNSKSTTCFECSLDQSTSTTGATTSGRCVSTASLECLSATGSSVCQNSGSCYVEEHQYYCQCTPGFTGKNCETRINLCDSNPCYNGGVCNDNRNGTITCYCTQGRFSGNRCQIDRNNCGFNPCLNNGSCVDRIGAYGCVCPVFSGYSGSSCEVQRQVCNDQPCQNRGQCIAFGNIRRKCLCQNGHTGLNCETEIDECLSSPCKNGGTCTDRVNGYSCQCASGYTGNSCEITTSPCSTFVCNNGDCVYDYLAGTVDCLCSQGYQKVNGQCQQINQCDSSPCQNGGTCTGTNSGFTCNCLSGFQGSRCQRNRDNCASAPCRNGGKCIDETNDYRCICDSGQQDTGGRNCDDQVDNCSPYPCVQANTRSCINLLGSYQCDCFAGYTGENCQDFVDSCASFPCVHGGTCSNTRDGFLCQCLTSYTGDRCELNKTVCTDQTCYNNGLCIDTATGYTCSCRTGYKGRRCEVTYDLCQTANPCVGPGSICSYDGTKFTCVCSGGYSGDNCEYKNNVCSTNYCLNGGTCIEVGGQPNCDCVIGFDGAQCRTNINDCTNSSCGLGAVCIDGVNSFSCQCESGKIGRNCDKDKTHDFDMILPGGQFLTSDYFIRPQKLTSTARLSLSFFVRYTESTDPGLIITLYGTNEPNKLAQSRLLLQLDRDNLLASISNQHIMPYKTANIDDGKWHHMVVTWDGSLPLLTLFIDSVQINSENHVLNTPLPQYLWFVLGGTYDARTNMVDQENSMIGRLSRVFVTSSVLTSPERISLASDFTFEPANNIPEFTVAMLDGVNALLDFNSELNPAGCYQNKTCSSLKTGASRAKVSVCPEDLMVISERSSKVSWPSPIFSNTESIRTNRLSGVDSLSWQTYSIAFAGLDTQGNADVCTYNLYNRRAACTAPKKPLLGTINCVTIPSGVRCSVTCDQSEHSLAEPTPVYYSCGLYNAYNDNLLTYRYPSCTECTTPKLDITMSMTYDLSVSCGSIGQSVIESSVRASITSLNNGLEQELCGGNDCSSISVSAVCLSIGQKVNINIRIISLKSTLTVSGQSLVTMDTLSVAVIDDGAIAINFGTLDRTSFNVESTPSCDVGRQLVGKCCVQCGTGTYYDVSRSTCVQCSRGTYLDAIGQTSTGTPGVASPCKACPGGMTTALTGAQIIDECKDSCSPGQFYNLTIGRCTDCPIGYYQVSAGTFFCQPCPVTLTTASNRSTSPTDCVLADSIVPATTSIIPIDTQTPSTGASTDSVFSPEIIALTVIAILVVIILIIVILCCCCRGCIQSLFPCCVTKVGPEEKTQWHYVNRFGETNLKFVSYKLSDIRRKKIEKQALMDEEDSPKRISIQVPVFEEKLNGTVKKKAVHVSRPQSARPPQSTAIPVFSVNTPNQYENPRPLPPLPERLKKNTPTSSPVKIKRPPSAFNKPRVPPPTQHDYQDFILRSQPEATDSRITIDSDEEDYR